MSFWRIWGRDEGRAFIGQETSGQGNNAAGDGELIIWRDTTENSSDKVSEFFRKQDYRTLDREFDVIYVKGDNKLQNLKREDESWKVRLIEKEFHRLMWDVEDV